MARKVSIIVPAYNERRTIAATLNDIFTFFRDRRESCEVIVAADGDDGTRERARELGARYPITVIGSTRRGGKGRGVRDGVRIAEGEVIGFMDADNKTSITEFVYFDPLLKQGADIVIGSRALTQSVIEIPQPIYRRWGAMAFRQAMHRMTGLYDIPDTQCGFKFFQRRVARDLFSRSAIDGYMFDVEILALARRQGYRVSQVPVRWRDDGDSRLKLLTGNLRNIWDLCRIRSVVLKGKAD